MERVFFSSSAADRPGFSVLSCGCVGWRLTSLMISAEELCDGARRGADDVLPRPDAMLLQSHTGTLCRSADKNPQTHTHPFNGPFSGTTQVSRYQKGKTNLDFNEARDSEWQWHQLGHMQVCTSLQTDDHTSTPPLSFLQAGCPSCHPTNSVKALKAKKIHRKNLQFIRVSTRGTVKFPDIFHDALRHSYSCCVMHFKHRLLTMLSVHYKRHCQNVQNDIKKNKKSLKGKYKACKKHICSLKLTVSNRQFIWQRQGNVCQKLSITYSLLSNFLTDKSLTAVKFPQLARSSDFPDKW